MNGLLQIRELTCYSLKQLVHLHDHNLTSSTVRQSLRGVLNSTTWCINIYSKHVPAYLVRPFNQWAQFNWIWRPWQKRCYFFTARFVWRQKIERCSIRYTRIFNKMRYRHSLLVPISACKLVQVRFGGSDILSDEVVVFVVYDFKLLNCYGWWFKRPARRRDTKSDGVCFESLL